MDDPIVHQGHQNMSHLHDFIGGRNAQANSTYASMQAGGTSCKTAGDTAGYWTPALYRNGVKVDPRGVSETGQKVRMRIYYNRSNLKKGTQVMVPPADLRMIAGNSHATSSTDNPKLGREIYWGCSDNSTGKMTEPPTSCATGIISLHVGFPNCWDGVLTHDDDTTHLTYPKSGVCRPPFVHPLPRIIMRWEYPVGTSTGAVLLSSGQTFTMHGDYWNTWDQAALTDLVQSCINADVSCGVR